MRSPSKFFLLLPCFNFVLAGSVCADLPDRPNIVIVMTDDQGWGDTGYYGHPNLQTPELDEMAASAMRFDRFYSVGPVCSPTRATQLTGRHYERQNIPTANSGRLLNREITLAELAQTQGYRTGHFGKWHLGALTRDMEDSRRGTNGGNHEVYSAPWHNGFDTAFSTEARVPTYWDDSGPNSYNSFGTRYWTGPGEFVDTTSSPPEIRGDDSQVVMDRAIDFINDSTFNDQPFLAVTWLHTPHAPVNLDPNYQDEYAGFTGQELNYYTSISAMDAQVGRLRDELRTLGIEKDTILIFTSDNGPENGNAGAGSELSTIGDPDGAGGEDPIDLRERKRSVYEGGIRVPGIVEWPTKISTAVSDVPVSSGDILPTMLDIWNIEMPDSRPLDGESFLPILTADASSRSQTIKTAFGNDQMIMDNRYKLVDVGGGWELYDIVADPEESNDIYDLNNATRTIGDALAGEYQQWAESVASSSRQEDYSTYIADASATGENEAGSLLSLAVSTILSAPEDLSPTSPTSDRRSRVRSDTGIALIVERQLATVVENLEVDSPGTSGAYLDTSDMPGGTLAASTVVESFLIHGHPVSQMLETSVTIEFENEILGVIADTQKLIASDYLASRDPVFGDEQSVRGALEPSDGGWSIQSDGRTIELFFDISASDLDQIRILTKSSLQLVPEPTTLVLMQVGIAFLPTLRRSRRETQGSC